MENTIINNNLQNTYLIGLGTNLGDRDKNIINTINLLTKLAGNITAQAEFIETEPLGLADQKFLNTCVIIESSIKPHKLINICLEIERKLGRIRQRKWENRIIDIDILLWQKNSCPTVLKTKLLTIPHPEMLKRSFVLEPACQIAANWHYPNTQLKLKNYSIEN